jgi:Xaa-Pro aminopeptidase
LPPAGSGVESADRGEILRLEVPELEASVELFADFDYPEFSRVSEWLSLDGEGSYPIFGRQLLSGQGLSFAVSDYADLIEEYLDTRIPAELEHYRDAVELTAELSRRAFSNEVIVPGETTVGDVRWWLLDRYSENGVEPWFVPDIRVQRRGAANPTSRGFLAVAPDDTVIDRGDLLHMDIGFTYMGLNTDWQKMAYVLHEGEEGAPEGLDAALAKANMLWEVLSRVSQPGDSAGEVYTETMAEMERLGIEAMIYSHPLGNQGHGLGASIDFRSAERENVEEHQSKQLREGSYIAIEFNIADEISEWDGQKVWVMQEDPAYLALDGWKLFVPRQQEYYLVY